MIVSKDFLKDHRETVQQVIKAHIKSIDWISAHPDETVKVVIKQIQELNGTKLSPVIAAKALSRTDISYEILESSIQAMYQRAADLGIIKSSAEQTKGLIDGPLLSK